MNILIADTLSNKAIEAIGKLGANLRIEPELGADDLPQAIGNAEILVVRSTKVNQKTLIAGKNLNLVIRAGAGVNTIDLETASSLGIHVANCPGKNSDAVAELTIGLMVALDRNIVANAVDLRSGIWNKKLYSKARGLKGRTLGILGLGSIGKQVAIIGMAMGIEIAAWSRSLTPEVAEELGITFCQNPLELAKISDIVSIHLAATKETEHIINSAFLNEMKDGAYLINTSRGEAVDTEALTKAITSKKLKVALDVYENEPGANDQEFAQTDLAKEITGTHHIGASTDQASDAIADEVVHIIENYLATGKPLHVVNVRDKSTAPFNLVVRHYNKVGVLAAVLDELRSAKINIEEMENSIFSGGKAAVCTLKLDNEPTEGLIETIKTMEHIIGIQIKGYSMPQSL